MLKIRCHELHNIMPEGRDDVLSVGAKAYLRKKVKLHLLGITQTFSSKACDKGIIVENQSIQLYNERFFKSGKKNQIRFENDFLTGEPDLIFSDRVVDIKSSWSWCTFPLFAEDAHDTAYEWQVRGYMLLTRKELADVAFCMVDTPDELVGHEPEELHQTEHIDIERRVTVKPYEHDKDKAERIEQKCRHAMAYMEKLIKQIEGDRQ